MASKKPHSTISYNTLPFLELKLGELMDAHKICEWRFLFHHGEDGDKDHTHLRIEPNVSLDWMWVQEYLREPDLEHPDLPPLGCLTFRPSVEEDWMLYVVHDPDYLLMKYGEDSPAREKLPYDWHDIQYSHNFDLEASWIRAKASLRNMSPSIVKSLLDGDKAYQVIQRGANPHTVMACYNSLRMSDYDRLQIQNKDLSCHLSNIRARLFQLEAFVSRYVHIEWDESKFKYQFTDANGELFEFQSDGNGKTCNVDVNDNLVPVSKPVHTNKIVPVNFDGSCD